MADYISREAASDLLAMALIDDWEPEYAQDRLSEIPAADVRPVVRGHYVGEYDGYADGNPVYDMWYCSECGCFFEDWDEKPTYNFCPNCGADMRSVFKPGSKEAWQLLEKAQEDFRKTAQVMTDMMEGVK